jgi:hypothetical protein
MHENEGCGICFLQSAHPFFVAFFQKDGLTKFVNTAIIKIMNVIQI